MKVLVACEFSGIVRDAFAARGHDAWSCDLLPTESPGQHLQCDVRSVLKGISAYIQEPFDGPQCSSDDPVCIKWDLMIAHPPCTHLSLSGAAWFEQKRKDGRQQSAIDFFMSIVNSPIDKWCIENPMSIMSRIYRKPDQKIHPYHFGDPYRKTTCLWLRGLKPLQAVYYDAPLFGEKTEKGELFISKSGIKMPKWYAMLSPGAERSKIRSKTFPGIAKAMAEQWG